MNSEQSLKEYIKENFDIDLPISGGSGSSFQDAIIIEVEKNGDWADVEYTALKYLLWNKTWKVINTSDIEEGGKIYDKLKVKWEDDKDFVHNYYFDVTKSYGSTTLWAGPHSERRKI